jgi:hypothetical protein
MSDQARSGPDRAALPGGVGAAGPDVAAIITGLRTEVERGRATGAYPASLLARLETEFHPDEGLEPPEASVLVESARPLRSGVPLFGGVVIFSKRVVRRLLSWYVAPIARDQTRFNLAILRELRALEDRVARLEGPAASGPDQPEAAPPRRGRS